MSLSLKDIDKPDSPEGATGARPCDFMCLPGRDYVLYSDEDLPWTWLSQLLCIK